MKKVQFIFVIIIEGLIPNAVIYIINKFKTMDTIEYFILTIGLIAIASTIVYYMLSKRITDNLNAIKRHNRTLELIMQKTGTVDYINETTKQVHQNQELIAHKNKHQ